MNKQAFTLAEVLITLVIIGVIAALTIPTLIQNSQKQEYVTALKKTYASINQALVSFAADHGSIGNLKNTDYMKDGGTLDFGEEFVKYFKVIKNCKMEANKGCFSNSISENYDGSGIRNNDYDDGNFYTFITADGTSILLEVFNCVDYSYNHLGPMKEMCGSVVIDVNGLKGPNNMGRDLFVYYISNGKGPFLYPVGGQDETGMDTVSAGLCLPDNTIGYNCTAKIMEEGWKMDY